MTYEALRVSPMMVLPEIGEAVARWSAMGFSVTESGDPECVGMAAGNTCLLLVGRRLAEREYGSAVASQLEGETVPYVYVRSLDAALATVAPESVLTVAETSYGTREAVVASAGSLSILVEKRTM